MGIKVRALIAVLAAAGSVTAFQSNPTNVSQALPRFEDFQVPATAIFKGTPAAPNFRTPGQRMYRTMIRQATTKGPNFAGHYTVAEWGCGTACLQIAVVDMQSGTAYDGPVGIPPNGAIYLGPNVEHDKTGIFYRIDSSLFIVVGCPNFKNCGRFYYEWSGKQFKLLRQIPMKPLPGSENYQSPTIRDAYIDSNGKVQIVYSDGTEFQPPKEKEQSSCSSPSVAVNKQAAGWLVEKVVCCQPYPIPTMLVVFRPAKPMRRFDSGTLILSWVFLNDAAEVAYHSDRSHGISAPYYGLFDVETGRLIDHWDGELTEKAPAWAQWLQ